MSTSLTQGVVNRLAQEHPAGTQLYDADVAGLRVVVGSKSSSYKLMDTAFHEILGKAFERSLAEVEPSDRLIEVLLKFRWPERLNGFLAFTADGGSAATAPAGLDPRVIARMEPSDRALLIDLLGKYLAAENGACNGALVELN